MKSSSFWYRSDGVSRLRSLGVGDISTSSEDHTHMLILCSDLDLASSCLFSNIVNGNGNSAPHLCCALMRVSH